MAGASLKTRAAKARVRSASGALPSAAESSEPARTPQRILDAAEKLFGEQSFDAISMRDISAQADVHLGLVHYHFGAKEALFEQVVARRASVLRDMRGTRLDALKRKRTPSVEDLMDAFMRPLFDVTLRGEPGWRSYVLLLAQLAQSNRWLPLLDRYFDETARDFLEALCATLPKVSEKDLIYGFNFALLTMLNSVAQNGRLASLSGGKIAPDDLVTMYAKLIKFVCSGLRGFERPQPAGRRRL